MTEPTVVTVDAGPRRVARRVVVRATAPELYKLVADPHRHAELDGSGTVRNVPVSGPHEVRKGDTFSVGMKQFGVPYKITSKVIAADEYALIEWQHPAGHRWRWEFDEIEPGVTEVTETFDYSTSRAPKILELLRTPAQNANGITGTLEKLAARYG